MRIHGRVEGNRFNDTEKVTDFMLSIRRAAAAVAVVRKIPEHDVETSFEQRFGQRKHLHAVGAATMSQDDCRQMVFRMANEPAG